MGGKGLDFKHKEVINITDGKRLRIRTRRNSRPRDRNNHIYNGCKIENSSLNCNNCNSNGFIKDTKAMKFEFERKMVRKCYITKQGEKRTGYVMKEKYEYDVVCRVEM